MRTLIAGGWLTLFSTPLLAAGPLKNHPWFSVKSEMSIDMYYSSLRLNLLHPRRSIRFEGEKKEWEIYRDFLKNSYQPRDISLETSISPIPYGGTLLKRFSPDFYYSAKFGNNLNLAQALTSGGFEDPWSLSLFLGDVVRYKYRGNGSAGARMAYSGYLASFGNFYILDSELIPDNWLETEWKIKGDEILRERTLRWSFRVGARFHSNAEIADIFYVGLRRSRTNYEKSGNFILDNTGFEYKFDFSQKNASALRHYFVVDKKFPLRSRRIALSIAAGVVWTSPDKYSGALAARIINTHPLQFILRPNLQF